jgi:hypothetical protein
MLPTYPDTSEKVANSDEKLEDIVSFQVRTAHQAQRGMGANELSHSAKRYQSAEWRY